jgi:hypothetical protein
MLVLPLTLSMVMPPLWAPWMDRIHIAEFRAKHSGLWALSQAMVRLGAAGARCSGSASAAPGSASPAAATLA